MGSNQYPIDIFNGLKIDIDPISQHVILSDGPFKYMLAREQFEGCKFQPAMQERIIKEFYIAKREYERAQYSSIAPQWNNQLGGNLFREPPKPAVKKEKKSINKLLLECEV